jgi:hypothetical protein
MVLGDDPRILTGALFISKFCYSKIKQKDLLAQEQLSNFINTNLREFTGNVRKFID